MATEITSQNFAFLLPYERQLDRLGALAERYFADDPSTALIKLRQFGEELARQTAARSGLLTVPDESQSDLLRRLKFERAIPPDVLDLFHQVRLIGNRATHASFGDHREALTTLKIARQLAIWFHRSFGQDTGFNPGPFAPPRSPQTAAKSVMEELEKLRTERVSLLSDAEKAREEAEAAKLAHESAEARARRIAEELKWSNLPGHLAKVVVELPTEVRHDDRENAAELHAGVQEGCGGLDHRARLLDSEGRAGGRH